MTMVKGRLLAGVRLVLQRRFSHQYTNQLPKRLFYPLDTPVFEGLEAYTTSSDSHPDAQRVDGQGYLPAKTGGLPLYALGPFLAEIMGDFYHDRWVKQVPASMILPSTLTLQLPTPDFPLRYRVQPMERMSLEEFNATLATWLEGKDDVGGSHQYQGKNEEKGAVTLTHDEFFARYPLRDQLIGKLADLV